jgi:hypothetical protein
MMKPSRAADASADPGVRTGPAAVDQAMPVSPFLTEAGRQLRAPWAASIAGLLFAALFTGALLLIRNQPMVAADDQGLADLFASGQDLSVVIGGLYLAPFAGIMFLWFIAVIRDQIGEREDRFFATVFLGSGLIFVAVLFVAAAAATQPVVGYRYLGQGPPTAAEMESTRALAYGLLFAFATRSAAVFMLATATIGRKSGTFPVWFARTGYLLGAVLMIGVIVWDWLILVLPAWVAVTSVFILRRERSRRGSHP